VTTTTEPGAVPGLLPQQIAEATARLEAYLARRCNPDTAYHMRRSWARFRTFQAARADRPLVDQVQAWLESIPASQQRPGRIAVKAALGTPALDWSALVIKPPRRNELRLAAGVLREDARAKVRAAARTPGEHALIELLWVLRLGEAAALCWGNLDLDQGMISVLKGKGAKPSWTLLPRSAPTALAGWFEASGSPPDAAPVFPRPRGGHYTPNGLGQIVQRLLLRADLWTRGLGASHRFRRSFATQYLKQNRHDLVGLQRLLRHNDIATTEKYVWFTPADLAPQMAALEL
jgi:integrase